MAERGCRRFARVVAVLLAALALPSCALFHRNLEPPRVTLKALAAEEVTSEGQVFRARLLLENPNTSDLRVVGGRVNLTLANASAGTGEVIEPFLLPASGSEEVDLRIRLDLLGVLPDLLRQLAVGPGTLDYDLRGHVDLDVRALGRLPFRSRGTLAADQLLRQMPGLLRRPSPPRPAAEPL